MFCPWFKIKSAKRGAEYAELSVEDGPPGRPPTGPTWPPPAPSWSSPRTKKRRLDAVSAKPLRGVAGHLSIHRHADMGSPDRSRLTLTVPIYNHFRYGDLDHKRAAHHQAQIELEETKRDASLRVRKSRRDYQTALASVETAAKQSTLAEEGLKIAEASYRSGAATSLDVTQARRDFTATAVNLATQRLKAQIALLNLLDAVGTDLLP